MKDKYPNPCDTCNAPEKCTNGCAEWRKRYRFRQKQINAYNRRLAQPVSTTSFCYEHPDIIRQYIKNGPCVHCRAEKTCETPCPIYWRWWDARMEWIRKRVGL